jgi:aspartate/methionine/tyrosine aminotransferase
MEAFRAAALRTEAAFEVMTEARRLEAAGRRIVHLEIGEPDQPTPPHIVEAATRALAAGDTRYAPPAGLPELREAIAADLGRRGVEVRADNVVVTTGAKPMILFAAIVLLGPGDEALLPDPGFPIYESVVRFVGARPVRYGTGVAGGGAIDPEEVAARVTRRTRLLVLNSPHNPTGAVVRGEALERLAELAESRRMTVLSDEVYSGLVYDGPHESIAALPGMSERTILIDSFSKTYAMTGWRLGFGVVPSALIRPVTRLVINSMACVPPFVQRAGLAALCGPQGWVRRLRDRLRENGALIVRGLNSIEGIECPTPGGAFYAFPDVTAVLARTGESVEGFARRLLQEEGVAVLPGGGFGPGGEGHLRLSYAASGRNLRAALTAIERCVGESAVPVENPEVPCRPRR